MEVKGSWIQGWVKKSNLYLNCCVQDAKSLRNLSGVGVMTGKMAPQVAN
jgi:hypothetical protein